MATVLDTFITRFGFETDTKGLKKAEKGLADLKQSAFKIAAVAGSILGGGFFLTGVAQAAVDTKKFADALGLTVEEMSTLEFVSQKLNVPIETLKGQAFNLAQALNEAAKTGAGISDDLTRFGLSATDASGRTKDLTTFINDVRVKMQGLNSIEQADLADKLFFDEETIALLKATPGLIAEITKEAKALGILTREDAAKAAEFQDGLINLRLGIRNVQTTIGNLFFDNLTGMFETLNDGLKFFEKHEKTFVKVLKAIGLAFVLMATKAAIAWAIALGPPALIAAAIAGISLAIATLILDFIAFKKGHKSAIGDALKEWPMLAGFVRGVGEAFDFTLKKVKAFWNFAPKAGNSIRKSLGLDYIDFEKNKKVKGTDEGFENFFNFDPKLKNMFFGKQTNGKQNTTIKIDNINVDAKGGDSKQISENIKNDLTSTLKNSVQDFDSSIFA